MIDTADIIRSQLSTREVGIEEFACSPEFCNPPDAPIWMGDLSFKPIGDVRVGDSVMGWKPEVDRKGRYLCRSTVVDVKRRQSPIVKVTMASGRTFRCTPDHRWLTASVGGRARGEDGKWREWFCPARVGRKLVHVVDPTPELSHDLQLDAAWLGGMFDGEGSCSRSGSVTIAQSPTHNPELCDEITRVLDALGIHWTQTDRAYYLRSTAETGSVSKKGQVAAKTQLVTNFVNWCRPRRVENLMRSMEKTGWRTPDEVVSIEPDGEGEVVALTTTTGNYVANGYASKNCGRRLYPGQLVLLKLLFLEEMEDWEEDILTGWINGVDGVEISPKVRERRDWLRERGYDHFGEYDAVAGRRASKNFIAGIAAAKIAYEVQRLGDPGDYYGIDPTKEIYFSGVAASLDQSKKGIYSDFVNTMTGCGALQSHIGSVLEETFRIHTDADQKLVEELREAGVPIARDFSKLRVQAVPANARTVRGITSMFICMDEMAFMMEGESASTGAEVYAAAEPSIAQFGKDGMIICQSSPATKDGQFFLQVMEAMSLTSDGRPANPHMLALKYPSWALYKGWEGKRAKEVCEKWGHRPFAESVMANPDLPDADQPSDGDRIKAEKERQLERAKPVKYKIERRAEWAEVLDAFLQPHVVDATFAAEIVVEEGRPDGSDFILPVSMRTAGTYEHEFYAHLDPASTTAGFGFALGHAVEVPDPNFEGRMGRHVVFDFVRRWDPATFPGHTIDYYAVLEEVLQMIVAFRPKEVTFDQFHCLAGDTLISTHGGIIPVAELVNPDGVLQPGDAVNLDIAVESLDGPASVKVGYFKGLSPTKVLTTKMGHRIEVTPEHRLWVRPAKEKAWHPYPEPVWRHASDIQLGDQVMIRKRSTAVEREVDLAAYWPTVRDCGLPLGVRRVGDSRWEAASRRGTSDYVLHGYFDTVEEAAMASREWRFANPDLGSRVRGYPTSCDESVARLLGWYTSEGYIGPKTTSFTNCDEEAVEDFNDCMESCFGSRWPVFEKPSARGHHKQAYEVKTGDDVGKFLKALGVDGLSHEKRVPDVIMRSPRNVMAAYLRAAFDGDGGSTTPSTRSNDESITYTTVSEGLARDLQILLLEVGVHSTLWGPYPKRGGRDVYRVKLFGPDILAFAEVVGFVSKRKRDELDRLVGQISGRGSRVGLRRKNSIDGDGLWVRVTSIEDGEAECYDLSVPGPESFVANGVVSHNSTMPIQHLRREMVEKRIHDTRVYEVTATNKSNWAAYDTLRTAMNMNLVHIPRDCVIEDFDHSAYLMTEMKRLQEKRTPSGLTRVEKSTTGEVQTKDVADCVASVTFKLLGSILADYEGGLLSMQVKTGAQGGYQIGGTDRRETVGDFNEFYSRKGRMQAPRQWGGRR